MSTLPPMPLPDVTALETREVWAALTVAHRHLAELKGLCESLPNQGILLDTLAIQEAKDSSEIENIITTHDELYACQEGSGGSAAAKEVRHYVSALRTGYPYTKIEFIERELGVSRPTASKYLEQLTGAGLVRKQKIGRTNFYINEPLYALLSGVTLNQP